MFKKLNSLPKRLTISGIYYGQEEGSWLILVPMQLETENHHVM